MMPPPEKPAKHLRASYDSLTLCAVVSELRPLLCGGQIQEIRQPAPLEIHLGIRAHGRNLRLLLSADARFARMHLVGTRTASPPTPPNFCMVLRRHLENAYIQEIVQRDFDRIMEITIQSRNEAGENVTTRLIGEFMGKHSNVILVRENDVILDAIKRIPQRLSRWRETLPGETYLAPPPQNDRLDPFCPDEAQRFFAEEFPAATPEALTERMQARFLGMSPFLAREMGLRFWKPDAESRNVAQQEFSALFEHFAQGSFAPVLILPAGAPPAAYPIPTVQTRPEIQQKAASLNNALDYAYEKTIATSRYLEEMQALRGLVNKALQRWDRQLHMAERNLAEAAGAERYRQVGELILGNLWRIHSGDASITVQDYFDPNLPDRILELDPALSPQENAELWFQRYRKARDGADIAQEQRDAILPQKERLEEALLQLEIWEEERASDLEALKALRQNLRADRLLPEETEAGTGKRKQVSEFEGHKIKRITTPQGYEILIGETATANDYLLTRIASPNDIWLHVRASASSHVVIRTQNRPESVPRPVLDQAALLCARHSSEKHAALVPVDYTLRKYVRKPRGSAPGFATYEREKTLHISP